jgi:hypothetical protein
MPGWACSSSRVRSARPVGLRLVFTTADKSGSRSSGIVFIVSLTGQDKHTWE